MPSFLFSSLQSRGSKDHISFVPTNFERSTGNPLIIMNPKLSYLSPTIPRLMVGYPCSWMVDNSVDLLESLIFPG